MSAPTPASVHARAGVAGAIAELWRYPVKSLQGERRGELTLDRGGITGDRAYALRDGRGRLVSAERRNGYGRVDGPLSLKAHYGAGGLEIELDDGTGPGRARPVGERAPVGRARAPRGAGRARGRDGRGRRPVHLVSAGSLAWLRAALPAAVIHARRFRPNVVVDTGGDAPVEQDWLGRTLRVGEGVELRVESSTERCGIVSLPQRDLPGDPRILRRIAQAAGLCFGVYAEVAVAGPVRTGDRVTLA